MYFLIFQDDSKDRKNDKEIRNNCRNWRCLSGFLLAVASLIFILALLNSSNQCKIDLFQNTAIWFVISGILSGIFFGLFNDWIYQYPKGSDWEYRNEFTVVNTFWVHLVSGFVAGIAAYLLINNFHSDSLNVKHLILFLIAFGGYTGLLPRWIWFFASKGGPGESSK